MRWYGEQYDVLIEQGVSANEILFESKLPDFPLNIYQTEIEHGERLQHGIDLFAKYFLDLWD